MATTGTRPGCCPGGVSASPGSSSECVDCGGDLLGSFGIDRRVVQVVTARRLQALAFGHVDLECSDDTLVDVVGTLVVRANCNYDGFVRRRLGGDRAVGSVEVGAHPLAISSSQEPDRSLLSSAAQRSDLPLSGVGEVDLDGLAHCVVVRSSSSSSGVTRVNRPAR